MGCSWSSVQQTSKTITAPTPVLESLKNKVNAATTSSSNHSSTTLSSTTSVTSPESYGPRIIVKTHEPISSKANLASEVQSAHNQKSLVEYEKLPLRDLINLNFSKIFKFKARVLFHQENFSKEYVFLEKIGKGGEGEVHKVFHKVSNQYRVAKIVNKNTDPTVSRADSSYKSLLHEAKLLSSLDHPNIVKVHEILQDGSETAVILEHLPGKNLLEHLNNPLFQTYEAVATIMEQLLSALAYLHGRGIIHKDLKLENIMFEEADPFSNLKLIDFGYAEMKDKMYGRTSSGTLIYMASEVFTMDYDEKCDLWSAGVILYLLLFKELPFSGKTSDEIVEDIFNKDLNMLFRKHKLFCEEPLVISFLQKLLERDPVKRYSAANALNDPFLLKYARKPEIKNDDLQLFKTYQEKTVMELVLSSIFIHNLMTVEEKAKFVRVFRALDKNRRGCILEEDLKMLGPLTSNGSSRVILGDTNSMGLELSKLMIASVDLQNRNLLRRVFAYLSNNSDMSAKMDEIYEILDNYVDRQVMDEIKGHFKDAKQELSYWDFDQMIKSY